MSDKMLNRILAVNFGFLLPPNIYIYMSLCGEPINAGYFWSCKLERVDDISIVKARREGLSLSLSCRISSVGLHKVMNIAGSSFRLMATFASQTNVPSKRRRFMKKKKVTPERRLPRPVAFVSREFTRCDYEQTKKHERHATTIQLRLFFFLLC